MCVPPSIRGRAARGELLKLTAWNSWGLSDERLWYVQEDIAADVTVLTELHGDHVGRDSERVIISTAPDTGDPAAGAATVLSVRASKRVLCRGDEGQQGRVVQAGWSVLQYVRDRCLHTTQAQDLSAQQDTWAAVERCVAKARRGDCIVLMGDLNGKVGREIEELRASIVCISAMTQAGIWW